MSEYPSCISLAMALGKSLDEARKDWQELNCMQPIYCQIIKDYPCECRTNETH